MGKVHEVISRGGRPIRMGLGAGEELVLPAAIAASGPSPWTLAVATSLVGAATGWVIEEIASSVRGKRRR